MRYALITAAALVAVPLAVAAPASATSGNASVTVVHAVPGLTVDVYANGAELLPNFKPGTITDPVSLPAGEYDLAVFADGEGPGGTPAIKADNVTVPAGANLSVVAHLSADGTPVLTPFVNDVSRVAAGQARLTVRHTAAAPGVDIRANGAVAFPNVTNPKEVKADLPAGTVSADVTLAGTSTVAIGPADVTLAEGTNTIVYAWGSAEDGNLALAVQTVKNLHSSPAGVPSGTGGSADQLPLTLAAAAVAGLGLALLGGARARRAMQRA